MSMPLMSSRLGLAWLGLALTGLPAAAAWTSTTSTGALSSERAETAGFSDGSTFRGIWFSCESLEPGRLKVVFTGLDPSLPMDAEHTVVVSVDGTAYLQRTRGERNDKEGDTDLVRSAPYAEFGPLIEALRKGRSVEISSPEDARRAQ